MGVISAGYYVIRMYRCGSYDVFSTYKYTRTRTEMSHPYAEALLADTVVSRMFVELSALRALVESLGSSDPASVAAADAHLASLRARLDTATAVLTMSYARVAVRMSAIMAKHSDIQGAVQDLVHDQEISRIYAEIAEANTTVVRCEAPAGIPAAQWECEHRRMQLAQARTRMTELQTEIVVASLNKLRVLDGAFRSCEAAPVPPYEPPPPANVVPTYIVPKGSRGQLPAVARQPVQPRKAQ
jgi:hypothetical protein